MTMKKTTITLIIATLAGCLCAQTQPLQFDHITLEDGLSQNFVEAIYQDSKGFMWFGTQDGLNRYDSSRKEASDGRRLAGDGRVEPATNRREEREATGKDTTGAHHYVDESRAFGWPKFSFPTREC